MREAGISEQGFAHACSRTSHAPGNPAREATNTPPRRWRTSATCTASIPVERPQPVLPVAAGDGARGQILGSSAEIGKRPTREDLADSVAAVIAKTTLIALA